ncbi:MAG TPA: hypothetical protein DET40_19515 [Lentisphaeria bacterium]|nr:MAG: hypothetical protein A2X45_18345 [Lentisphaerae bacterium GWF2_50_93]HCE45737.1 hypothetical protein [Lentisphaeria bacterium]
MKNAMTIDNVLEIARKLPIQDQEECVYLISRRIIEEKRKKLLVEVRKAETEYSSGKAKRATVDGIMKEILS